jgi:hypothetical protein
MSPLVELAELITGGELARRLGISRQRMHQLRESDANFPPAIGKVGHAFVWRWPDVAAWARRTGRSFDERRSS